MQSYIFAFHKRETKKITVVLIYELLFIIVYKKAQTALCKAVLANKLCFSHTLLFI